MNMNSILVWIIGYTVFIVLLKIINRETDIFNSITTKFSKNISISGPATFIKTEKGKSTIDKISNINPKLWKILGNIGIAHLIMASISGFILIILQAILIIQNPDISNIENPKNMLVIPGVNDFLPLSEAPEIILALIISVVLHELGHGVYCRVNNIKIESVGVVLLSLIPMGAFVKPDEKSQEKAKPLEKLQMVSAGVLFNLIILILSFSLLIGPISGIIGTENGASVGEIIPNSPADKAGIEEGSLITKINGENIQNNQEFINKVQKSPDKTQVTLDNGKKLTVNKNLIVTSSYQNKKMVGSYIQTINGKQINSIKEFNTLIENQNPDKLTIKTSSGDKFTTTTGIMGVVYPGKPLANAGIQTKSPIIIKKINGEQVYTLKDMKNKIPETGKITVTYISNDNKKTKQINIINGILGIKAYKGYGGLEVSDFGVKLYPSEEFLSAFKTGEYKNNNYNILERLLLILLFPLQELNGNGFTGFSTLHNFYDVSLTDNQFIESTILDTASLLFWLVWLNINLIIFNSLPILGLDGGYVVKYALEPFSSISKYRNKISLIITLIGLLSVLSMVFIPFLAS